MPGDESYQTGFYAKLQLRQPMDNIIHAAPCIICVHVYIYIYIYIYILYIYDKSITQHNYYKKRLS